MTYLSATDKEALDAFQLCCKLEGIIPALEPAHALAKVMRARAEAAARSSDGGEPVRARRQGHLLGRRASRRDVSWRRSDLSLVTNLLRSATEAAVKYDTGEAVQIGDRVMLWAGYFGHVVCSLDTAEFSLKYPRENWGHLTEGLLIEADDGQIIHYPSAARRPKANSRIAQRARVRAPRQESNGLRIITPARAISAVLRVTSVRPWTSAVAASRPSIEGRGIRNAQHCPGLGHGLIYRKHARTKSSSHLNKPPVEHFRLLRVAAASSVRCRAGFPREPARLSRFLRRVFDPPSARHSRRRVRACELLK